MSRWLRALVIALLLPAYSLAAVGVGEFLPANLGAGTVLIEGHENPESLGDGFAENVADLVFELGDTSDDAAELPTAAMLISFAAPLPDDILAAIDARPPVNTPESPLRPPKVPALRV